MRRSLASVLLLALAPAAYGAELDGAFLRGSDRIEPPGPSFQLDGDAYPAPAPAYWAPAPVAAFAIETGARFWFSSKGSFTKNLFDDPRRSNGLASRLTYSGLEGRSGEVYFRIDHTSGFFAKGYGGLGTLGTGTLNDEDFPPLLVPYSSTLSDQRKGHIGYVSIDYGYNFFSGPTWRVGAFAGYHYFSESMNAFGCTQIAGNTDVCVPVIPTTVEAITESAAWNSVRIGLTADVRLFDCLNLNFDAAWLPYVRMNSADNHWLRTDLFGDIAERAIGTGVQLEASASYQFTNAWSLGVGARYWRMQAKGGMFLEDAAFFFAPLPQPGTFVTDRFGVFAQSAYKFAWN